MAAIVLVWGVIIYVSLQELGKKFFPVKTVVRDKQCHLFFGSVRPGCLYLKSCFVLILVSSMDDELFSP